MARWSFITNHGLVLLHIAEHPNSTLREIADAVGITERAALSILRALEEESFVSRRRDGRRNQYEVDLRKVLEQPTQGRYSIAELVMQMADLVRRLRVTTRGE